MVVHKVFTKKDVQDKFNISLATVNNWIKTGVIPNPVNGCYTNEAYLSLIQSVEANTNKLQSRANRSLQNNSTIIYCGITNNKRKELLAKLIDVFEESKLTLLEAIACLGKQILICNNLYTDDTEIYANLNRIYTGQNVFSNFYIPNENDDILGAFYQSIQSIAYKSKTGSFYTPSELLTSINIPPDAKVLDPCCGSGSMLIHTLSQQHDPNNIYAFDTDTTALLICRLNLILFFNNAAITPHIERHDLIFPDENVLVMQPCEKYDFIITNPPWGSKLTKVQKDYLLHNYPALKTTEVFSIALYKALEVLSDNGKLYFFLPTSILTVAAHKNIRKILLASQRNIELTPLGVVFKGVQSECVLLQLSEKVQAKTRITIKNKDNYNIDTTRITPPYYFISYNVAELDDIILNKLYDSLSMRLPDSTKFALGIVTGNNKQYIHNVKQDGEEPVFRGKDILPYRIAPPEVFINFQPNLFQQVAPIKLYRSKKIVYRFISDKIVCAIDEGHLVLNSANFFITKDYPMEILVCLFNSPIYSFIYQKRFLSRKVLKQHLQELPLPILTPMLIQSFNEVYAGIVASSKQQDDADMFICDYFNISGQEYQHIKECVYGKA